MPEIETMVYAAVGAGAGFVARQSLHEPEAGPKPPEEGASQADLHAYQAERWGHTIKEGLGIAAAVVGGAATGTIVERTESTRLAAGLVTTALGVVAAIKVARVYPRIPPTAR